MKQFIGFVVCFFVWLSTASTQSRNPLPSNAQLKWHENNYYFFMHFGPNTFTGKEWGDGKEKTSIFNPVVI